MRIKDIWPTFGDYEPTKKGSWIAGQKKTLTANQMHKGRKALHRHYCRYTNVLSMWITEQNLKNISIKNARKMTNGF